MKEVVWLKNCSGRCYKSLVTPRDHIGILNQNCDLGIKIFKKFLFLDRSVEYGWKYELCDVIGMWRNWSCNKYCDKLWRSCCFPNWYPLWNCLQHSISSWFRNGEILDSVIRLYLWMITRIQFFSKWQYTESILIRIEFDFGTWLRISV